MMKNGHGTLVSKLRKQRARLESKSQMGDFLERARNAMGGSSWTKCRVHWFDLEMSFVPEELEENISRMAKEASKPVYELANPKYGRFALDHIPAV